MKYQKLNKIKTTQGYYGFGNTWVYTCMAHVGDGMLVNFGQKPAELVTNPETVFIKADSVSI